MKNKTELTSLDCVRKSFFKVGTLALSAILVTLVITAGSSDALAATKKLTDSKVESYEAQLAKLNQQMETLQGQISTAKSDIEKTIAEKERIDGELNILIQKIGVTNALISELATNIEIKNGEISDSEAEYQKKYEIFKERLRVAHEDGQVSYIAMLFGADSISDFLSRADRVGAMLEYDTKVMADLKNEKANLETAKGLFEEQKAAQESYLAQLKADEAALDKKKDEAANYYAKLQSNRDYYITLYEKQLAAEEQLQKELQAYLKELERQQNNKYVGGTFMWPLPLAHTRVSSYYGYRPNPWTGKQELHNGIDIPAPYGTDIYASNSGTVTTATSHWSYGNYIMINHGGGYATLYAHCSQLLVQKGDKVTKGQLIARVGSTGSSTGNHLHFSLYENSAHTDPMKFFK